MAKALDPIVRSVVQHRLISIVEEMGEAMLRTTYSQILNASRDFSIGICDQHCRLLAQADHIPIHVGALTWATRAIEEKFGERIKPGDVILLNDPYTGGSHLPDVTAFLPIYGNGKRLFWSIVRAHMGDIGGATPGAYNPDATEIWQEGLRIPPIKLYEGGQLRDDVLDLLALNVRFPRDFRGDLAAMVGAAHLGERRIQALFTDVGVDVVSQAVEVILDSAESQSRAIVSKWKDGIFRGEALMDDDGRGRQDIKIVATVTKRGSNLEVDLTESDPQSKSFANSSHANTHAAVVMAFAFLLDPDVPKNEGCFRPLTVKLRPGTVVFADDNVPVTLCTTHPANEIIEAVVKALSQACPDRVMAGWSRRFRISVTGENPRTNRRFIWHMFHARPGGGASPRGDGWSAAGEWHSVGGVKFGSIEVAEARFPLRFDTHEFRPDSGGDGQYRGGLGTTMDLIVEVPAYAHTAGEGIRHGAAGMLGGSDGLPHDYRIVSSGGARALKTKQFGIEINAGERLEIRSGGGGGWGPPERRATEARERDVETEFVSKSAEPTRHGR
jgi:N-methylhydantoinase B